MTTSDDGKNAKNNAGSVPESFKPVPKPVPESWHEKFVPDASPEPDEIRLHVQRRAPSRVVVGDEAPLPKRSKRHGRRALSGPAKLLLTAIVAALLTFVILHIMQMPPSAPEPVPAQSK